MLIELNNILLEPGGELVAWDYCLESGNVLPGDIVNIWEHLGVQSSSGYKSYGDGFSWANHSACSGPSGSRSGFYLGFRMSRYSASGDCNGISLAGAIEPT